MFIFLVCVGLYFCHLNQLISHFCVLLIMWKLVHLFKCCKCPLFSIAKLPYSLFIYTKMMIDVYKSIFN